MKTEYNDGLYSPPGEIAADNVRLQKLNAELLAVCNNVRLRKLNAELLAACKSALLRLDDHDPQSAPEALLLRAVISKAEGK
jgi:hypothetical protein